MVPFRIANATDWEREDSGTQVPDDWENTLGLKTIVDHIQVISPMKNLLQLKYCNSSPFTFFLHAWNAKVEISNDKLFRYLDRLEVQTACLAAIVRAVRAVRPLTPWPVFRQEELDLRLEALDMRLVILK